MNKIQRILAGYRSQRILVIGDFILDCFFKGSSTRLSPDAPVPVVALDERAYTLGGAANVAMNLRALGAEVHCCTVTGADDDGRKGLSLLTQQGIGVQYAVQDSARTTIVKTRVQAGAQIITRFDYGNEDPIGAATENALIAHLRAAYAHCDVVLVADYGKGVITDQVLETLIALKAADPKFIAVDSKRADYFRRLQPSLVKPNYGEAIHLLQLCRQNNNRAAQLRCMGDKLYAMTGAAVTAVTLDTEGALIFLQDDFYYKGDALPIQHPNCNGAGDTFISVFALSMICGASLEQATELAGIAASIGMGKSHTAFCSREELYSFVMGSQKQVSSLAALSRLCARYRAAGKRIVFTNGCFDILHSGHVSYLDRARALGDVLIVGVNNDDSIRRLKGNGRPVNPLEDRMAVLSGLAAVDHIISFGAAADDTPVPVIEVVKPAVFVKGGDYAKEDLPEAALVEAMGGKVELVPYIPERSTTRIISRIYHITQPVST